MLLVAVELIRRVVVAHEGPREDAALANHAADAAHRERAAAEAEEKDLVARLVVGDEETVGVVDVVLDAAAEGAAAHAVDHVPGAHALVVVDHLQRAAPGAIAGRSRLVFSSRSRWSGAACQRLP